MYVLQFEDIKSHGTKIIVYNLWLNDEGIYELNFDDDDEVCLFPENIWLSSLQSELGYLGMLANKGQRILLRLSPKTELSTIKIST